jgi:hypothetical protein
MAVSWSWLSTTVSCLHEVHTSVLDDMGGLSCLQFGLFLNWFNEKKLLKLTTFIQLLCKLDFFFVAMGF